MALSLILISLVISAAGIVDPIYLRDLVRQAPTNYITLAVFTMCHAFFFSFVTTAKIFPADKVLAFEGLIAGMTFGITAYSCYTNTDFTKKDSLIVTLSLGLIGLVLLSAFITFAYWWLPFLFILLVVAHGLYLIYDTQLIAGGQKYSLTYDEYIVGAMLIHIDFMILFFEALHR